MLFVFFGILPLLALVFGIISSRQIATSGGRLRGRGLAITGIVLGVLGIIGFGVFAWAVATDRIEFDDKSRSDELSVGDCVTELPAEGYVFNDFEVTACDEPHEAEVYYIGELNGPDAPNYGNEYPGETEASRQVEQLCVEQFDTYVGLDFQTSIYDVYYVAPSEQGWDLLDGEFTCLLYDVGNTLTASARGSAR